MLLSYFVLLVGACVSGLLLNLAWRMYFTKSDS